jgi:hypothetical protein
MILGVDFDNTIVCYDHAFYHGALAKGLIPPSLSHTKNEIRNYLRDNGQEEEWIELQGFVYGACMEAAEPFPGVIEFFQKCHIHGIGSYIISHKTRYPYRGIQYDLHSVAFDWISKHELYDMNDAHLSDTVFLELTKEEKIQRIITQKCTHFIDDLPEFLSESTFPPEVHRILFDPHHLHDDADADTHISSWSDLSDWLTSQIPA